MTLIFQDHVHALLCFILTQTIRSTILTGPNLNESPRKTFERRVESAFPIKNSANVRALVAVSGGPDSIALLRAITSNVADSSFLVVGHVNHQLRGKESIADEEFVRQIAHELDLRFLTTHLSGEHSDEESLRNLRHDALIEMAGSCGARYIMMGHNLDDQVETILFRIFRGTGIAGLTGIPKVRLANECTTIVRPLLEISREEIEAYLNELDQNFRVDATNNDSKYTRNFLRNDLIPMLKSRFGEALPQSIVRLGMQAAQTNQYVHTQATELTESIVSRSDNRVEIDLRRLADESPLLIRHFLVDLWVQQSWPRQSMTFRWWETISNAMLSSGECVPLNLPGALRFSKQEHLAVIEAQHGS